MFTNMPPFMGDSEIDQIFKIFRFTGTPINNNYYHTFPHFKTTFPRFKKRNLSDLYPEIPKKAINGV